MTTYALEFFRIDGRFHIPTYSTIPADTAPADELSTFLNVMRTEVQAGIAEMSPGRYAVYLREANQCWSVRLVEMDERATQQDMAAVELDTAKLAR